jgi:threonine dehydratase
MGIQVPPDQKGRFTQVLKKLDYPFWDETDNPAYRLFAGVDAEI